MDEVDALIVRIRRADTAAFESLYDRYARLVYCIAFRMLGDVDVAEDVTQAVFLKVWLSITLFRGGNFTAWLSRLTRNHALDVLRLRSRHIVSDAVVEMNVEPQVDEMVFAHLDGDRVRSALANLPEEQRLPIMMGFFDGITHEEIARRVAAPLGTVKTRIRSGLHKLRAALFEQVTL